MVKKVHRGDLVEFEGGFTARFTGLKAPALNEFLGSEVYDFTRREIEGKLVAVFTYTTNNLASGIVYDEEGYPLVQIKYGKNLIISINELLLRKGYARVDEKYLPADLEYFKNLEKEAQDYKLGIWNIK